jgi:outer membrane protein TolC
MLLAAVLMLSGCVADVPRIWRTPGTSDAAAVTWQPPTETVPTSTRTTAPVMLPEDILNADRALTLFDIVDITLRNNAETAAAWAQAKSAAAAYGSWKGSYYPQLGATAGTDYLHGYSDNGRTSYNQRNVSAADCFFPSF